MMPSIQTKSSNQWVERDTYVIKNPFVVILGIGKYNNNSTTSTYTLQDIIGMKMDYKNMIALWNIYLGYSIFYRANDNSNRYYKNRCMNNQNLFDLFKMNWSNDDINVFTDDIMYQIDNEQCHDSLIFIISSHGNSGNYLYDSNHNEYQLLNLINKFNQQNCMQIFGLYIYVIYYYYIV